MAEVTPDTPPNHARRLTAKQKQAKALELRTGGATYEVIAKAVGYSTRHAAHRAVSTALRDIPKENAEALRELELNRLDEMTLRLTARLRAGDLEVVNKLLRVMDARAKLTGIYQLPEGSGDMTQITAAFGGLMASAMAFAQAQGESGGDVPPADPAGA